MVNGRRRDRAPFCVAGAALGAADAAFAWQVQHLESLGAACGQRPPRDRAPFCVAGAALREPGRCLWSTASAGPRTFLPGRCSTRCTGCCFCVAGATHLARLISLHSSHTTHLTQLHSHNSSPSTQTSQLISFDSLHSLHSTHLTPLPLSILPSTPGAECAR